MLDTAFPAERDVDVTLLYQTARLEDITAGESVSTISKDGSTLHVMHLAPGYIEAESVETPHYLYTLRRDKPLVKEGMLTVTARTAGNPLVMANLLTTTTGGAPDVTSEEGEGYISGTAGGKQFAFTTEPGNIYEAGNIETDALAVTWSGSRIFAAMCGTLKRDGELVLESGKPVTFEKSTDGIKYYHCKEGEVAIGVSSKPAAVTVNGKKVSGVTYDAERKAVILTLPAGEGMVQLSIIN